MNNIPIMNLDEQIKYQKRIRNRHNRIIQMSRFWSVELSELQQDCQHFDVTRIARSDTGNFDPRQDCYWYDCKCNDCGKRWQEKQ